MARAHRRAARRLQDAILGEIRDLGMARASFEVRVTTAAPGEVAPGPHGMDTVEFLISPNPGEFLKPLHKIASGGELSRVMLAIRVILAAADQTATLIFDEVDAGIGGRVADSVGARLRALSGRAQVLCVTHLPQVAAYADPHIHIAKQVAAGRTQTTATHLEGESRVAEIARMMAGDISAPMLEGARTLLQAKAVEAKALAGRKAKGESEAPAKGESESARECERERESARERE